MDDWHHLSWLINRRKHQYTTIYNCHALGGFVLCLPLGRIVQRIKEGEGNVSLGGDGIYVGGWFGGGGGFREGFF